MRKLLSIIACLAAMLLLGACSSIDDNPGGNGASEGDTTTKAKTTVIIYGTAGGTLDNMFENFIWELAPAVNDPTNMRVAVLYKYGRDKDNTVTWPNGQQYTWKHTGDKAFKGRLADAGDVVKFELTSKTDVTNLRPYRIAGEEYNLWDEGDLTGFLDEVKEEMPADNYVLIIYGHGGGWDPINDVMSDEMIDDDDDDDNQTAKTRGVLYDEWTESFPGGLGLDMYEFERAVKKSKIGHFSGIFLHNCLMGNAESLSQIYSLSDYTLCSMHSLTTNGTLVSNLAKTIAQTPDFLTAAKKFLAELKEFFDNGNKEDKSNGDLTLIDNRVYPELFPLAKRMTDRLKAMYADPVNKEQMDFMAGAAVYLVTGRNFFVDLLSFAQMMLKDAPDAELEKICGEMSDFFDRLIPAQIASRYSQNENFRAIGPKRFTISVVLMNKKAYNSVYMGDIFPDYLTIREAYEMTRFHKLTGFGDFLNIFDCSPMSPKTNPTGQYYD